MTSHVSTANQFSVSLKSIWETLKGTSKRTSKNITATLYQYSDIPLKLFIDIAGSGEHSKIVRYGNPSQEQIIESWEAIVKENSRNSGENQYESYFGLVQGYWMLICEYTLVRNMLLKLAQVIDYEYIQECRNRGYNISTKDSASYEKSIAAGLKRSANLITRARMKQSEIEREFKDQNQSKKSSGFEEIMANLTAGLGFVVPDDITLARYNEYKKMIKSRNQKLKEQKNGRVQ